MIGFRWESRYYGMGHAVRCIYVKYMCVILILIVYRIGEETFAMVAPLGHATFYTYLGRTMGDTVDTHLIGCKGWSRSRMGIPRESRTGYVAHSVTGLFCIWCHNLVCPCETSTILYIL